MNIRIPVIDNYGATSRIRHIRCMNAKMETMIAMTTDAFADDIQKCLNAGMKSYFAKLIEPVMLYKRM